MIKLFIIPGLIMLSCGSTKSNQSAAHADSVIITAPVEKNQKDPLNTGADNITKLPACIKNKIDSFKAKDAHERPQKVVEYTYKGKKVYYVVMPCCDFFNEVYDAKCNFLGSPDGGFTGKGDGKIPDFFTEAKGEKLIWAAAK
jgi:hypothetical protein